MKCCPPLTATQEAQKIQDNGDVYFCLLTATQAAQKIQDNGDVYFCLIDVADVLEISRSSDLLQVQKDFVKNETPKNRGTLDPKGVEKIPTPTKGAG